MISKNLPERSFHLGGDVDAGLGVCDAGSGMRDAGTGVGKRLHAFGRGCERFPSSFFLTSNYSSASGP